MFSSITSTSPRRLASDAGVLPATASHNAEAVTGESLQNVLQQMVHEMVRQQYEKMLAGLAQQPTPKENPPLSILQTANLLQVTRQTVHNRIRRGELMAYKNGGSTYLMKEEVLAALEAKKRPDGTRKHARRQFNPSPRAKQV